MSGGTFDYKQHEIFSIAESIADTLAKNNTLKPYSAVEPWDKDTKTGRLTPGTTPYWSEYSEETIGNMLAAYRHLRVGYEYAHQTDLLLAGDIGEETYNNRIKEIIQKTEREVSEFCNSVTSKEPEHLNRCLFCSRCKLLGNEFYCDTRKKLERIKDPLVHTCEHYGKPKN